MNIPGQSRKKQSRGIHRKPEQIFSVTEADDRLRDIFSHHGFGDFPHDLRHQLARFYELLMKGQQSQNFTRLLSLRDVAIKHYIDCLIVPKLVKLQFPLLDIGTGAGFPGIPLKIVFPNEKIILAEGVQKRVEFLKLVRETLELQQLDIIGRNVNREFSYPVEGAITRAVEDTSATLENVISCLQTGGVLYLMKGPNVDAELRAAVRRWKDYYYLERDIAYDLPQTPHKRRLLVWRKIKAFDPEEDAIP